MKTFMTPFKNIKILFLYLFPLYCIFTGAFFRTLLGDLSLRTIDPDYVYFSNGLDITLGSFDTGNIFHPGAPLQYFTAIIFRLIFILRSPGTSYLEDIYTHPDLYVSVVSFCFTGMLTLLLLLAGWKVYRYTGSVLSGILIQITPFMPLIWFDITARLTPEIFQVVAVLLLSVITVKYYTAESKEPGVTTVFLFALVSAFGLSAKVTFLPLLIIPFLILKGMKQKIIFTLLSLIFFLLISASVLLKLDVFWGWIRNLFIHSGSYGGGEANIIDLQQFKANLIYLVVQEKFFFQVVAASILIQVIYVILRWKKEKSRAFIHTVAISLAIFIHLLMVSKHFAHRNYIPSLLLMPLLVYYSLELIRDIHRHFVFKAAATLQLFLFFLLFIRGQLVWLPMTSEAMGNHVKALEETRHVAATLEDESIKIITSQNYGAPFIEYALMYSTVWSDRELKAGYDEVLARLYPNTYQHTTFHDRFEYWGEPFDVSRIAADTIPVYLYIERDDDQLYDWTLSKLKEVNPIAYNVERSLIYRNAVTTEVIYKLNFQLPESVE